MPLRMKEVHIVRQPFLFNMVWPMFKQFVGDKLKKRVSVYGFISRFLYELLENRKNSNYECRLTAHIRITRPPRAGAQRDVYTLYALCTVIRVADSKVTDDGEKKHGFLLNCSRPSRVRIHPPLPLRFFSTPDDLIAFFSPLVPAVFPRQQDVVSAQTSGRQRAPGRLRRQKTEIELHQRRLVPYAAEPRELHRR